TPELFSEDATAARSAAWFYTSKGCLKYPGDVLRVTQIINGGQNGLEDRRERYIRATEALL
ncbi:glycoside hydrolase family 19 protein, partial [Cronobacter sakazakii]|nr:glycoside hydrolase family 19 protein [Cronobacter sakazakii]